jgi:hypothetical protein
MHCRVCMVRQVVCGLQAHRNASTACRLRILDVMARHMRCADQAPGDIESSGEPQSFATKASSGVAASSRNEDAVLGNLPDRAADKLFSLARDSQTHAPSPFHLLDLCSSGLSEFPAPPPSRCFVPS